MRLRTGLSLVLLLAALPAPGAAQLASLLKDIHTSESAGSSTPGFLGSVAGWTYFTAESPWVGRELWVTDGSPEHTDLLADACSGPCSSAYATLASAGETLFLALSRHPLAGYQEELVVAKGSPPEFASIWAAAENVFLQQLSAPGATALLDDRLVFSSTDDYATFDLLITNAAGTGYELLQSFELSGGPFGMRQLGSEILFWVWTGESSFELWATNGTPAGTRRVQSMGIEPQQLSIALADRWMLFVARDSNGIELWRTDGSSAGTFPVTHFTDPAAQIWKIAATATHAFFFVEDVTFGQELWTTDGSAAGTHPVTAFGFHEPFGDNEYASHLVAAGSHAFFFATDGIAGVQVWSASPSSGSASPVVEVCPVTYCSHETWLESIGSQLFFLREDPNLGVEVWTSDGTATGTRALRDACPGTCWGGGTVMATAADKLVYAARDSEVGQETVFVATPPWTGSQSLFDAVRGAPLLPSYIPTSCTVDGTRIYFGARDSQGGSEPWVSAGSPSSTLQLADIAGASDSSSGPHGFASNGATVAFLAFDDTFNDRFWLTGGAEETTRPVTSSTYSCIPWSGRIYPLGDKFAEVGCYGEIQVIDPASSQLEIIETDTGNCFASAASGAAGGFLVAALGCEGGDQIWRSDGTPSGTVPTLTLPPDFHVSWGFDRVADHLLAAGWNPVDRLYALSANLSSLTAISPPGVIPDYRIVPVDEPLGFFTHLGLLWRTDGTAAGTFALGPTRDSLRLQAAVRSPAGYDLLIQADFARAEIWFSDGTVQGTTLRASVPLDYGSEATLPLERAGSHLYFVLPALERPHLWVLEDGGFEPRRLQPTTGAGINSQGSGLAHIGERVIFPGCDEAHGCELWTSDGTAAGTRLLHDIAPGASSSNPEGFFTVGSRLYLAADDGLHGLELWSLELDGGPPCRANARTLCLESGRFQVTSKWRDFAGNTGYATAAPITGDTGYFWFFDEDNVELILKLIDGGGYNGHHWVYYGALSNVEYTFTVTDSETGAAKRYFNPAARFASSGDITAFGPQGAHARGGPAEAMTRTATPPEISLATFSVPQELPGACVPTTTRFCILNNRFAVTATWRDFAGTTGTANAGTLTDDTGYLWFFDQANVEVVLKMVDAGAFNGHFWVYYGALSNVEYTLTVTDTVAGGSPRIYRNALGQFGSFGDIEAFPAP